MEEIAKAFNKGYDEWRKLVDDNLNIIRNRFYREMYLMGKDNFEAVTTDRGRYQLRVRGNNIKGEFDEFSQLLRLNGMYVGANRGAGSFYIERLNGSHQPVVTMNANPNNTSCGIDCDCISCAGSLSESSSSEDEITINKVELKKMIDDAVKKQVKKRIKRCKKHQSV